MGASNWVHLEGASIKAETELAFLVAREGEEHWIPKSQVADADSYQKGDTDITLSVSEWFAKKEGIEGNES